jgi:YHS domain-containing protein
MLALLLTAALVAPAPQAKPATNTKCPVAGEKVDPKTSPKVVVRGQEYYICCKACAPKLEKDPDKYLDKDGTPKNAK